MLRGKSAGPKWFRRPYGRITTANACLNGNGVVTRYGQRKIAELQSSDDPKISGDDAKRGNAIMSKFTKGWAAVSKVANGGSGSGFKQLKSGDTLLVKFKDAENDVQVYFAYSVFGKVNTFVPKNPAERNDAGFPVKNLTSWDRAAKYYYDMAKEQDDDTAKKTKNEAYKYVGKPRVMVAVYDITKGEDIVVDLTMKQAEAVMGALADYEPEEIEEMVFKMSKKGSDTNTTVVLSPVINIDRTLDADQKANLNDEKASTPIPDDIFEGKLVEKDEDEMLKDLFIAGFNLANIGETLPEQEADGDAPAEPEADPTDDF